MSPRGRASDFDWQRIKDDWQPNRLQSLLFVRNRHSMFPKSNFINWTLWFLIRNTLYRTLETEFISSKISESCVESASFPMVYKSLPIIAIEVYWILIKCKQKIHWFLLHCLIDVWFYVCWYQPANSVTCRLKTVWSNSEWLPKNLWNQL